MEIKTLADTIEKLGRAWEEHKDTTDKLLAAKAEGKSVADIEAKLDKIGKDMDALTELKQQIEDVQKKLNRPSAEEEKGAAALALEVKGFNLALRSDYQAKGKPFPGDLSVEAYTQYKSGFFKMVAGVAVDNLTGDERKALSAGSDPDGGYLLPNATQGRVVSKVYEMSHMRQLATVQTISTGDIEGIIDNDETDAGWVSEMGARTGNDGTPQVGKWRIEAHEMYALPKASQKILDDAATDIEGWLAGKMADKFARVESTAFWSGTGVGQPRGLASYTTAATADATRAWGQFEHTVSGASAAFHTDKFDAVHTLMGTLKDRYLQNACFCMRRSVRTAARKIKEATTDRYMWEPGLQAGQPERLMGYPVRVDEYMPALAANSLSLAFGDFREAYLIVDRMGIRTLRDPYTSKPYVVFYSTKRTGGGALNFEAVKFMKFGT